MVTEPAESAVLCRLPDQGRQGRRIRDLAVGGQFTAGARRRPCRCAEELQGDRCGRRRQGRPRERRHADARGAHQVRHRARLGDLRRRPCEPHRPALRRSLAAVLREASRQMSEAGGAVPDDTLSRRQRGFLGFVERVGNLLPEPTMIFVYLIIALMVLSTIGAALGWSATLPFSGDTPPSGATLDDGVITYTATSLF